MKIIAIGGGSVRDGETEAIDRELVRLAGVPNPKLLFIPTASSDAEDYILGVARAYSALGCRVNALRLLSADADPAIAAEKIEASDLIYVGGGNTKMMLEIWRTLGVDVALRNHLEAGKPAGGLSAGSICWFRMGNSDWPVYEGIPGVNTAPIAGLAFYDLVVCPHTKREVHRLAEFREMMKVVGGVGLGLDDGCAIQIIDDQYRILASSPDAVAHRIEWKDAQLIEQIFTPHDDFRPLSKL